MDIIDKLHPLERKVLPLLGSIRELAAIAKASGLQEVEVMRALQWLENKGALKINQSSAKIVALASNGLKYVKQGLPEKRLYEALSKDYRDLQAAANQANLTPEELAVSIGVLKKKSAIDVKKENKLFAKKLNDKVDFAEQAFLSSLPLNYCKVNENLLQELLKRKSIIKIEDKKTITITLTDLGKRLSAEKISCDVVNRLTAGILKTGEWKNKNFRAYDVEINVPVIHGGKKHFVNQAVEYARQIWLEMGFKEMTGPLVNTSFWNFDALFTAQDHPVRELQDTFYLGGKAEFGKLPEKKIVNRVKQAHENGGLTGSKGWQYSWDEQEAKKNVLRTHTTVLTALTLANLKQNPAKYFALGRCFRNEALDWKHLFEFNQTEGIVIDENANFRHLLGYLKEFFRKMGFPQARFRPAYFPYTEPSIEIDVFHPEKKEWIELGGAGMLRPEVVMPLLGKDIPVLAWGPGFDRLILEYYNVSDIRDLYKNDIKQLREAKVWLK